LRHADGGWCWIEGIGTNLLEEPDVRAVVVNYHDVTARKCVSRRKTNADFGVSRTGISADVEHSFRSKPNARFG
jgi:hypothetical protein